MGRLTRDPEIKTTKGGTMIANFSIATNRSWKDKNGEKQESATFHNVVAYGKAAEILQKYTKKGDLLYLRGRIENSSWEGDDGVRRYRSEVVVEDFQLMPKSGGQNTNSQQNHEPDNEVDPEEDLPF